MRKLLYICLLLFTFIACQTSNESAVRHKVIDLVKEDRSMIALEGIFEDFQLIPFENKRECMLSNVRRLCVVKDKVYVYDQNGVAGIYRFNADGSFDRRVGNFGHGKNEYAYVKDVAVADDGTVAVLSVPEKVQIFDNSCQYQRTIELPDNMGLQNLVYGHGMFVGSSMHSDYAQYDPSLLYFFDKDFNLVDKNVERLSNSFRFHPLVNIPLVSNGKECCYFDFFRNQFFVVDLKNPQAIDVYDVNTKERYTIEDALNGAFEKAGNMFDVITSEYLLNDKLMGWMVYERKNCFFEYDMSSGESHVYQYQGLIPGTMCYSDGAYYAIVEPFQLQTLMKAYEESEPDNPLYQALKKMDSPISMTDNFYLLRMKHKGQLVPVKL